MTKLNGAQRGELELSDTTKKSSPILEEGKRSYSCWENVSNYFIEFCNSGTIHGVRYFGENRTIIEKIWWALSITVSLYFCVDLILSAHNRWENSPVIVSFATKENPVWKIPFPAITICPEAKTRASVFNYTHYYHRKLDNLPLTDEEEKQLGYLSFLCDTKLDNGYKSGKFTNETMLDFFNKVQPDFFKNIFDCKYLGQKHNCRDLFTPIITDDGICYTFNIVDRSQLLSDIVHHYQNFHQTKVANDWELDTGFSPNAGLETYPRRALLAGVPYGLEAKLAVDEEDLDYTCGTSVKGFKVQISHPQRMPWIRNQHFIVPLDRVAKAGIAPDMMTTSKSVKAYDPTRRNCHFPHEKSLKFFKIYTQNNCAIECQANYTLQQCGCVKFYMPRETGTNICNAESHKCLKDSIDRLNRGLIQMKIDKIANRKYEGPPLPDCQCLPICTSMYYNVENTQANWDWRATYKYKKNSTVDIHNKKKHMAMLQVFFKGHQFIYSERNELYGGTEFLANVGGLLGLFIGFSALSLVEILYYLSLRIFCNIALFGRRNWAGKED